MKKVRKTKEPIGTKIHRYIDMVLKKLKIKMTQERKIDILRKNGLKIGKNVIIDPAVKIDQYFCHLVSIGDNCILCEGVLIIAHDATLHMHTDDYGRAGRVDIKDNCIISANAVILPGVTIGPNVLVAAGSVATPWTGTRLGDGLNNNNITFDAPKTVYWNLAGTQNWSATGWATTNNGAPAANNFPLPQDTATFTETEMQVALSKRPSLRAARRVA